MIAHALAVCGLWITSNPATAVRAAAWLLCLGCLSPAVARLVRWRQRYLDPIWLVVFLLAMNRLSYLAHASMEVSHATATILALVMAGVSWSYQRHDA